MGYDFESRIHQLFCRPWKLSRQRVEGEVHGMDGETHCVYINRKGIIFQAAYVTASLYHGDRLVQTMGALLLKKIPGCHSGNHLEFKIETEHHQLFVELGTAVPTKKKM